ncbi:MAG: ABC transporter substrate-binding protein [Armatimonadetes bacterium]|nr:ABC transporter substrate-binding protein [Armatimonadota bacterium]
MSGRILWWVPACLLSLVVLVAGLASAPSAAPRPPQALIYGMRLEPKSFDPAGGNEQYTLKVLRSAYEGLVQEKFGAAQIEPSLAESWTPSADRSAWTFKLRRGVKFSDGAEFDAEAVRATWDRLRKVTIGVHRLVANTEVQVVDRYTVTIKLNAPDVYFLYSLAKVPIVSPKAIKEHDEGGDFAQKWLAENTAGTGPYRITRWEHNQFIQLDRFAGYWRGWSGRHLDQVKIVIVPEHATMMQMLERLEIDMHSNPILPQDVERLKRNAGLQFVTGPASETAIFSLNTQKPPLDNKKFRQGLTYLFDYPGMAKKVLGGFGRVPRGFLAPGLECYTDRRPPMTYDPAKGKALIEQSGARGATLLYHYTAAREDYRQAGLLLQDALRGVGVEMKMQEFPFITLIEQHKKVETSPHMAPLAMGAFSGDPVYFFELNFHSKNAGGPYNWSYYKNAEVDGLLQKARATPDRGGRCQMLGKVQEILVDDAAAIYMVNPDKVEFIRKRVKGYRLHPLDFVWPVRFYELSFEE